MQILQTFFVLMTLFHQKIVFVSDAMQLFEVDPTIEIIFDSPCNSICDVDEDGLKVEIHF